MTVWTYDEYHVFESNFLSVNKKTHICHIRNDCSAILWLWLMHDLGIANKTSYLCSELHSLKEEAIIIPLQSHCYELSQKLFQC